MAVVTFAGVDEFGDLPLGEIDGGDLAGAHAGDPGDSSVGLDEDLLGRGGDGDFADYFHGLQIDDGDFVGYGNGDKEPAAIARGGGAVAVGGQRQIGRAHV